MSETCANVAMLNSTENHESQLGSGERPAGGEWDIARSVGHQGAGDGGGRVLSARFEMK